MPAQAKGTKPQSKGGKPLAKSINPSTKSTKSSAKSSKKTAKSREPPSGYKSIGRNFFPPLEQEFMLANMDEFCKLNGKEAATAAHRTGKESEKGKKTINNSTMFFTKMMQEYQRLFPYRHPEANMEEFTEDQREQQCDVATWHRIPNKLHNWMQKAKPAEEKHKGRRKSKTGVPAQGEPKTVSALNEVYQLDWERVQYMHGALDGLRIASVQSWAEVKPETLERRQNDLGADLGDLTALLSRSTGAEIYAIAVWRNGSGLHGIESCSPRTKGYLAEVQMPEERIPFIEYAKKTIGPCLQTDVSKAAPCVYGDPAHTFYPRLPPVDPSSPHVPRLCEMKLTYTWMWQGGRGGVPWRLVEDDTSSGNYYLVEKQRLPAGVTVVRQSCFWTPEESRAWFEHLKLGDDSLVAAGRIENLLPEERIFQWLQPSPGVFHDSLCRSIAHKANLRYEPESIIFAQRLANERNTIPIPVRDDELPPIPLEPYIPISEARLAPIRLRLPNSKIVEILEDLKDYEELGPYQMTGDEWIERRKICMFLKYPAPGPDTFFEHFVTDDLLRMGPDLFNNERDEGRWSVEACLDYVNPAHWTHKPTATAMGGPCGCRWPIFMLLLLSLNDLFLRESPPADNEPRGLPQSTLNDIESLAVFWHSFVLNSATALGESIDERRQVENENLAAWQIIEPEGDEDDISMLDPPSSDNEWEELGCDPAGFGTVSESESDRELSPETVEGASTREKASTRNDPPSAPTKRRKRTSSGNTPEAKRARAASEKNEETDQGYTEGTNEEKSEGEVEVQGGATDEGGSSGRDSEEEDEVEGDEESGSDDSSAPELSSSSSEESHAPVKRPGRGAGRGRARARGTGGETGRGTGRGGNVEKTVESSASGSRPESSKIATKDSESTHGDKRNLRKRK